MNVVSLPEEVERKPRAVAIGSFDGVHRGHRSVLEATRATGLASTVITFDPHPRIALGNRVDLLTTLERRLELIDGGRDRDGARGAVHARAPAADSGGVRASATSARSEPRSCSRARTSASASGGRATSRCWSDSGSRSSFLRGRRRVVDRDSSGDRRRDVVEAAAMLGRPFELDGTVVAGDQRGGTLGYPTANLLLEPDLACPRYGIYAGPPVAIVRRSRSGRIRTTVAPSGGSSRICSTSRATCTGSASSSRCGSGCGTKPCSARRTSSSPRSPGTSRRRGTTPAGAVVAGRSATPRPDELLSVSSRS